MPENVEIFKITEWLITQICREGKWATFKSIHKISEAKQYANVDLEPLLKCVDKPLVDLFSQGKHFFLIFSDNVSIHAHLMMKGSWYTKYENGSQFKLTFAFGDEHIELFYHSQRFGQFEILDGEKVLIDVLDKLAPCFLGRYIITEDEWMLRFKRVTKRKNLRVLLMDQEILVSGIGNYLIAEIFYRAKLHWNTSVGELTDERKRELFHIAKNYINDFYEGKEKKVIYKQKVDPLGNAIVPVKMSNNRTFWSVPAVQGPNLNRIFLSS